MQLLPLAVGLWPHLLWPHERPLSPKLEPVALGSARLCYVRELLLDIRELYEMLNKMVRNMSEWIFELNTVFLN